MTRGYLLLETTDSSLRILLLVQLYTAIYLRGDLFDTGQGGRPLMWVDRELAQRHIRQWFQRPNLVCSVQADQVIYRCPIGLSLASKLPQPAPDIVRQVADCMLAATVDPASSAIAPPDQTLHRAVIKLVTTDAGWLEFHCDDRVLQAWLWGYCRRYWVAPLGAGAIAHPLGHEPSADSAELWQCWYCYQRCRSLLARIDPADIGSYLEQWNGPRPTTASDPPLNDQARSILLSLLHCVEQLEAAAGVADPIAAIGRPISQAFRALEQYSTRNQLIELPPHIKPAPIGLGLVILIQSLLGQILPPGLAHKTL